MQLPRGIFRDLKKGIGLELLLNGLKEASFSGYCQIVSGETSLLLVLRGGEVILAKSGNLNGDEALVAIVDIRDSLVDAALHDLNETQLQLAVEFNPSAQVTGNVPLFPGEERSQGAGLRAPSPPAGTGNTRLFEGDSRDQGPASAPLISGKNWHQVSGQKGDDESALLLKELDALELMDIETMARKFRKNCRQMIEKLELEHLLEHDPRKGRL
jgi:hypothetical protein